MKLNFNIFLIFSLVLVYSSCDNDFDLIEGEVNIPIVYGLLSAQDTAHYIRVEKAFVDKEIGADVLAQDPNQLYYADVEVQLVHIYEEKGDTKKDVYTLNKVDGNLEGYVRQEGAFAQSPNYLYKIHNDIINLKEEETYQLRVIVPGEDTVKATTTIIEGIFPSSPSLEPTAIGFFEEQNNRFRWSNGRGTVLTSCELNLNYFEQVGSVIVDKTIAWTLFNNVDTEVATIEANSFYTFLGNNLEVNPEISRIFINVDINYTSGGQEIQDFLSVSQANLGITSSGDIPVYSNLSRGRGIFSSRSSTLIQNVPLTDESLGLLKTNPLTAALNFK